MIKKVVTLKTIFDKIILRLEKGAFYEIGFDTRL